MFKFVSEYPLSMPDETRHAEPGVDSSDDQSAISVPFREAIWIWVQVAVYSFGGAAGQISVMHKLLVEKKRWIDEERFLHAMNFTMLLPGPEAQQLATYIGWLLHKTKGGIVAGTLFVLPGFVSILLLSILYVEFRQFTTVEALFFGLQAAVLAIVAEAVLRIGKRVLKNAFMIGIAAGAFIGIFAFNILFPIIIIGAALVGVLGYRLFPGIFSELTGSQSDDSETETVMSTDFAHHTQPSTRRSLKVATLWLGLWLIPLVTMIAVLGRESIFVQQGTFFSTVAVIVFGGAYAVLAYVAQEAVLTYGWLEPGEMIDGLGMAETTPGPTIQVVQFVGFMGAYRNPGTFDPLVAGVVGSIIVTWVTFIPCFLFIFLGAPYIEYLRGRESLSAALSAVTAAVVGVILNLAIWFAIHVLFANQVRFEGFGMSVLIPVVETLDPAALAIVLGSFGLIFGFNQGMMRTLTAAMVAGLVYYLVVL